MRKELLTVLIKMRISEDSPYREYCFVEANNNMLSKVDNICYVTLTFVLEENNNEKSIKIEAKAYNKVEDNGEYSIAETYLDEAINPACLTENPERVNLLLPFSITNTDVSEITSSISNCDDIDEVFEQLWILYGNILDVDFGQYTFRAKVGNSLHTYLTNLLFDNNHQALEVIKRTA